MFYYDQIRPELTRVLTNFPCGISKFDLGSRL